MNFEDFYNEKSNSLKSFYAWWKVKHQEKPDFFPMDLLEGDWEEQFELWERTLLKDNIQ